MLQKSKSSTTPKTRETRAAYRARTRKTIATRLPVVRSHAAKLQARQVVAVPWEERVAPTSEQLMEWHLWLNEHADDLEAKYSGKFLAIWDKQIIASGNTRRQVYSRADQARSQVIPLITYIPIADEIAFAPSNFPIEWSLFADGAPDE
ncbi:MAG: hypothetical protein FJ009_16440 [Chloroflexi bacterium]|nr:hypothetical protein [Chloroflexota bacterium]